MKKFILIAALLAGAAQAQTLATSPNTKGGQIRLMAGRGDCGEGFRVLLTTIPTGEFLQGCWAVMDDKILAVYSDGTKRLYDMDGFTLVPQKQAAPSKQSGKSL